MQRHRDDSGPDPSAFDYQCRGKIRYTSKRLANGTRRVMVAKSQADCATLAAYRCSSCHGWHLGNMRRRAVA